MKHGNRIKWLCGWLALCLLLGIITVGFAEEEIALELPEAAEIAAANDEAVDSGLDLTDMDEAPEDLVEADDALALDLDDGLSLSGDPAADEPAAESMANDAEDDGFYIDEDGLLYRYEGPGGNVVIPDGVTGIGENVFSDNATLTGVTIPGSVQFIGKYAFYECENLEYVKIGKGLHTINDRAFSRCEKLTAIALPNSVEVIESHAFSYCTSLASVTLHKGLTSIGSKAFKSCTGLTKITIPGSVKVIESDAFGDCDNLARVTLSEGLSTIESYAFEYCTSLTSITIPDSVTTLGFCAFSCCYDLVSVKLGSGVADIDPTAFNSCGDLKAINVSSGNRKYASRDGVLYTHDMKTLLRCPSGKTSLTIPNTVVRIADGDYPSDAKPCGPFSDCGKLKQITIPDSVTYIGDYAFAGCSSLTSVVIPRKVTRINTGTFIWCYSLEEVELPEGLTLIDYDAFLDCGRLKHINLPDTLETIEWSAFAWCESLTSVVIPDSMGKIGEEAFLGCSKLTSVTIPKSVNAIGNDAFLYCPKLTIRGVAGSTAERYAKDNDIPFQAVNSISIAKAKVTVSAQVYTGAALKPTVKVVLDGKTLKKGTDYTVEYADNQAIGKATVTVRGKGDYTGTVTATFKIKPKAVKGLKLTAGKRKLTAKWKKGRGITGYQLQYALKKSFKGAKKVTISKASEEKATVKKLKSGKTYYVRIRAYKKVGKTKYYSAWSATKTVKVK